MITADSLVKRFGGLCAISNLSLKVQKGMIVGLIGPNGAGKSTLVNLISGFYKPDKGHIFYKGEDITGLTPEMICQKGISRTFQIVQGFPEMTAYENVLVAATFGTVNSRNSREKAKEMLNKVEFPLSHDTLVKNLSTVQLRRLDLARSLASEPTLLLLDEIASGLTLMELDALSYLIRKTRDEGVTIIMVEHVVKFIGQICDYIVVLHEGQKLAEGTPSEVYNNELVVKAYLGEAVDFEF